MTLRYFLILALLPLVPTAALADTRDDVLAGASRCAAITDDRAWLDCYYGSAQPMRAQLGLPPAPASQISRVPPPYGMARPFSAPAVATVAPAPATDHRGLSGGIFGKAGDEIKMASYSFDKHGMFTVTLANGETWQQMADDSNFAHWRGPASAYNVSVAPGKYGHAALMVENDGQTYEVRRAN
jgi:hypothetical protein